MDKLVIDGGRPLKGRIEIGKAKNAVLAEMAASLLGEGTLRLRAAPRLKDVDTMGAILQALGMEVSAGERELAMTLKDPTRCEAPYELVRTMRASFFVLGPLLARRKRAKVSLPGGCAIGARPINYHLNGLSAMGAEIDIQGGYVEAKARRLRGARVSFETASVGATENVMMAACLAEGTTVISNAAREPEVSDLAELLKLMGARIDGAGTDSIEIEGVKSLNGADFDPIPDRIEAGTYLILSLLTGCGLRIAGARREHLSALEARMLDAGARLEQEREVLFMSCPDGLRGVDIITLPYPGFPTDMQAQWIALMALANGSSAVRENVFENRFQHVPELNRMGADISVKGTTAIVKGVSELRGAPVMISDLRGGAALVLAGLAAKGRTEVHRIYHLDRGYDRLVEKLKGVGAAIERAPGPPI